MTERPRASMVVLRNEGREVLMVRHRRVDGTDYWQLPGGGVQVGEMTEATALRELWEANNFGRLRWSVVGGRWSVVEFQGRSPGYG